MTSKQQSSDGKKETKQSAEGNKQPPEISKQSLERNTQPPERINYILLAQIIFGLLGVGLMIGGIIYWTQDISTGKTWLSPTGITLIIVGFIILCIATKGKCFLFCEPSC